MLTACAVGYRCFVGFANSDVMRLRLITLVVLVVSSAVACSAEVGPMPLDEMTQRSWYIVLARVSRVAVVDDVKLAELEVSCVLKGDANVAHLYYWASPGLACDVSDAEAGEEGLYFLWYPDSDVPRSKEHLSFLERAHSFTQGERVYLLEHWGRGRLLPEVVDGESFLYAHKHGEVMFPTTLEIIDSPDPTEPDLGLVRLYDVLSFITECGA